MQPFLSGPLMFMHCGILHHHRDLMECGGSAADYARSVGALEAGNSDSAFLFRIFVSFYRKGLCVEQAIRATLGLVSQGAPQPCSLNLVATDGETTVLCRHRTPGDDAAPPRLFVKLDEGSVIVASVPVQWAGEGKWAELEPDCVCVIEQGELQWGAPVVAGEGTAETVASEPRVSEAPSVPFGLHRGDALATADTMLRDVVRQSVAAAGARKKEVGRALSLEKKALFDVLRRDMAVSVVRSDALVAAAVEALEAAAEADATCGFGNDGNLARAILSELEASAAGRGTPKNALALLQARLYDSRYDSGKSGAGGDRAGVEEVSSSKEVSSSAGVEESAKKARIARCCGGTASSATRSAIKPGRQNLK